MQGDMEITLQDLLAEVGELHLKNRKLNERMQAMAMENMQLKAENKKACVCDNCACEGEPAQEVIDGNPS